MSDDEEVPLSYLARSVNWTEDREYREGDEIDGYVPVEPYNLRRRPSSRRWAVHPHDIPVPPDIDTARVVQRLRCDCRRRSTIVRAVACSDGLIWAAVARERIPTAARRDGHSLDGVATPLHRDEEGLPCLQIGTCVRCRQTWLAVIYDDRVEAIKLRVVKHGARVKADGKSGTGVDFA